MAGATWAFTWANAADMSALPQAPMVAPAGYDWYGVYVGAHGGGARAQNAWAQTTPGFLTSGTITSTGGFGGAQIGINNWLVTPHLLLGVEADVSGASLSGDMTTAPGNGAILGWDENADLLGTLRGRIGYAERNWLVYATGGFAWDRDTFTRTQIQQTQFSPQNGDVRTNVGLRAGWTVGAGFEYGLFGNWTVRAEYLHLDLDGRSFRFSAVNANGNVVSRSVDEGRLAIDTFRVGLNYLFR
jgi:opacity protein-like surface antigen